MKKAKERNVKIHLPVDFVCAEKIDESAATILRDEKQGIEDGWLGLDIGPQTIKNNAEVIARAKTIFWNGPQGVFEMKPFANGSYKMTEDIIKATEKGAVSVAGGGDTLNLLKKLKAGSKLSHVSTGGGASLELLEGKKLPGIEALSDRQ